MSQLTVDKTGTVLNMHKIRIQLHYLRYIFTWQFHAFPKFLDARIR